MTTIYYFSTIFIMFIELSWILSPIDKANDSRRFNRLSKEFKNKKWDEYSEEYKSEIKSKVWQLYFTIWLLVGLFTVQWVAFLSILIFNFIIVAPISKLVFKTYLYPILHWFNSIIGFSFAVFVVVNHYYLHIDLYNTTLSFFFK